MSARLERFIIILAKTNKKLFYLDFIIFVVVVVVVVVYVVFRIPSLVFDQTKLCI